MNHWDRKEYIGHANELDSADKRLVKYKQEYEEFGFDSSCTWNLDYSIAKFILPRLKMFVGKHNSTTICSEDLTSAIGDMLIGFELMLSADYSLHDDEHAVIVQKAWDALAKYNRALWW